MITALILIWGIIGFVAFLHWMYREFDEITLGDLIVGIIAAVSGPLVLIWVYLFRHDKDIIIYKRK